MKALSRHNPRYSLTQSMDADKGSELKRLYLCHLELAFIGGFDADAITKQNLMGWPYGPIGKVWHN